jgi:glycosyltransferase involved in cell wall biosynthesis
VKLLVVNWQDLANPHAGGAEVHLHELFGRLARRGHPVTLLCSGFAGAPPRDRVDDMEIHRVGGRHSFTLAAAPYFRRHLAGQGFDLVVEDLNKIPLFTPAWSRLPVVLLVHHLFGATAFREASAPFAAATWLLERPIPWAYRGLPVEAVSESSRDDLVARGLRAEDIRVIHNGVDLGFFHPAADEGRAPEPEFLSVGRLKRYTRIDHALEALALLAGRGVRARLVIAGRGDDEPRLRQRVQQLGLGGQVSFAGFVSEAEKRRLLRRAWATVQPSPKEGWGITNIEAAACGTPTLASDSPGLRESVVHDSTGLLYPHGDIAALATAMQRLAGDRSETERLGRGALAFAAGFTWERAAELTEAHLAEVLRRAAR